MNNLHSLRATGWSYILLIFGPPADKRKFSARLLTAMTVLFLIFAGSPLAEIDYTIASAESNPYAPAGTILVDTNNEAATFTITGSPSYTGSGTSWTQTDAPAGDYTIAYGSIPGYDTPASDTQTLASGSTITFTGIYTKTIYTVILKASEDAYISNWNPGSNYGTNDTMTVRSFFHGTNKNGRSLVMFNISSLPSGSAIISATLQLNTSDVPAAARNYKINKVEAAWDESIVNWNDKPAVASNITSFAYTPSSAGWMEWDVTPDIQAFVNGNPNYGWQISDADENSLTEYKTTFYTKESASAAPRPVLVIQYAS